MSPSRWNTSCSRRLPAWLASRGSHIDAWPRRNLQHVPVGPYTAHWAFFQVRAAVQVVKREPGQHPQLEAAISQEQSSTL